MMQSLYIYIYKCVLICLFNFTDLSKCGGHSRVQSRPARLAAGACGQMERTAGAGRRVCEQGQIR